MGERSVLDVITQSNMTLVNTTVSNNTSSLGSAVMYVNDVASISITNCTFDYNTNLGAGNSFSFIFADSITITNSYFYDNIAIKESNHIYTIFSTITISG